MEVTSGPLRLMECVDKPETCEKSNKCTSRAMWVNLTGELRGVLDRYTLDDLAQRPCAGCRATAARARGLRTTVEAARARPRRVEAVEVHAVAGVAGRRRPQPDSARARSGLTASRPPARPARAASRRRRRRRRSRGAAGPGARSTARSARSSRGTPRSRRVRTASVSSGRCTSLGAIVRRRRVEPHVIDAAGLRVGAAPGDALEDDGVVDLEREDAVDPAARSRRARRRATRPARASAG